MLNGGGKTGNEERITAPLISAIGGKMPQVRGVFGKHRKNDTYMVADGVSLLEEPVMKLDSSEREQNTVCNFLGEQLFIQFATHTVPLPRGRSNVVGDYHRLMRAYRVDTYFVSSKIHGVASCELHHCTLGCVVPVFERWCQSIS